MSAVPRSLGLLLTSVLVSIVSLPAIAVGNGARVELPEEATYVGHVAEAFRSKT